MTAPPLVEIRDLARSFRTPGGGEFMAVSGVDLDIREGESVGVVGESGSGKSTLGRLALALIAPTKGSIRFDGRDLASLDAASLRRTRPHMQVVFQNPHTSMHPRMTVEWSLSEPLRIQGGHSAAKIRARVGEMVDIVGMPRSFLHRYPHELSGGQKQRICIARALMLRPKLIVLDEPTSALDVSVQAQILDFLRAMQREWNLAYLFISHNLAVIQQVCSRVVVMYRGRIVEQGPVEGVLRNPRHPYTQRLLAATLVPTADASLPPLDDQGSGLVDRGGCPYVERCSVAIAVTCDVAPPPVGDAGDGRLVRCHLPVRDRRP